MKLRIIIFCIVTLLLVIWVLFFVRFQNSQIILDVEKQVCFNKSCFQVEIADTPTLREKGLMYISSLDQDKGMLFIFPNTDIYSFWMKNTLIPLDMIWIDENMDVVYIKENALPCVTEICEAITPDKNAKYVLEVNVGIVNKTGLKMGNKVKLI